MQISQRLARILNSLSESSRKAVCITIQKALLDVAEEVGLERLRVVEREKQACVDRNCIDRHDLVIVHQSLELAEDKIRVYANIVRHYGDRDYDPGW